MASGGVSDIIVYGGKGFTRRKQQPLWLSKYIDYTKTNDHLSVFDSLRNGVICVLTTIMNNAVTFLVELKHDIYFE